VSDGLLVRRGGEYMSSPMSAAYLMSSSPTSLRGSFERYLREIDGWHDLSTVLRDGPRTVDRSSLFDRRWIQSIAAMALCGSVQKVSSEVSEIVDLRSVRKMLDIGGGHGLYSIAFSARNPEMDVYVLDLPGMVPVAEENIAHYRASKVHVIAGDFTHDDIGSGYDMIFSSFNPSGSEAAMVPLLEAALAPRGWLVVRQFTEEARNDALMNLGWNFVSPDGDRQPRRRFSGPSTLSIDEFNSMLVEAGLRLVRRWPMDSMSDITVMRKPVPECSL
jgi:hypothetical protein